MARATKSKHLVFVSHSSTDTWVAKQVAREIQAYGAIPFLDEATIEVGADFEDEIRSFLERANELVVLLTPWALDRKYVWAELGAAWGRRLPIIVLLHGITPSELQNKHGPSGIGVGAAERQVTWGSAQTPGFCA